MAKEKICGIYCIENLRNSKKYIGQSVDIYKRWSTHISMLNNGSHCNQYLQNAWNKYGEESFRFNILEKCKCDKDILNNREQYWINYYNSYDSGYNLTAGGDGTFGVKCSDEKKQKISKANTGRKNTQEQKDRISKALLNNPNVLRGENHPYYNKKLNDEEILRLRTGLKNYYENNSYTPSWSKKVICVTTGKIFNTLKKAANYYGINQSNISSCCEYKREFAGELADGTRLQWEFYEDGKVYVKKEQKQRSNKERPILQYDLEENFIKEWKSAKECNDFTGIQRSRISDVCRGKRKQTGGYIFKYKDAC